MSLAPYINKTKYTPEQLEELRRRGLLNGNLVNSNPLTPEQLLQGALKYGADPSYLSDIPPPPPPAPTGGTLNDIAGFGRTALRGGNNASVEMLNTAGNAMETFDPANYARSITDPLGEYLGVEKPDPDSLEGKLHKLSRKINPGSLMNMGIKAITENTYDANPTEFEKKYSKPIWQTKGGTTIIPSLGQIAYDIGNFAPEVLMSVYGPAQSVGNVTTQRFAKSPVVAENLGRAAKAGFGGAAGALAKGHPEDAALNAILFPVAELTGQGLGYYAKAGSKHLKEMAPMISEALPFDESGALRIGKLTPPAPEPLETLNLQLESLVKGRSKAVLVTPGSEMPIVPKGFNQLKSEVGTWIYDPKKLKPFQIKSKVLKNKYGELLGHIEPKSESTGQVVTAIQNGVEAKSSVTSPDNMVKQARVLQQQFPEAEVISGNEPLAKEIVHARSTGGLRTVQPEINPATQNFPRETIPTGAKERGFTQTVRESQMSPEPLSKGVSGTYEPITNRDTLASAQRIVQDNPIRARDRILSVKEPSAEDYAVGMELIRQSNAKGDFGDSIRIANRMAELATEQGQAIQALSMYNRLGPDGILKFASKTVQEARAKLPKAKVHKLDSEVDKIVAFLQEQGEQNINKELIREEIAKKFKLPHVSEDFAKNITERATALQAMPEGREKALMTAEMLRDIAELVPSPILRKISSFQTIAQLYNPKTLMRNLAGNAAFGVGENVKDFVAAPIDRALSVFTKQRTKSLGGFNQLKAQAKGFASGLKEGTQEAWRGVDLTRVADKWEINALTNGLPRGRTFRGKIMGNLERTLGVALRAPDRAFYKAAVEKSLAEQMSLTGTKKATEEMLAKAHFEGLYKTFQDDSAAAKVFSGIKKALNADKEFGIGDILIKYPKTPGNLLARSVEYSPAGIVKSIMEVGKAAMGHGFDQQKFVDSTARAIVGTGGLTGAGYVLSDLGLLKNSASDNDKLRNVERMEGVNQSQLNVTGLIRWISSGFDKSQAKKQSGDLFATYDWAVPLSVPVSMGARAQEMGRDIGASDLMGTAAAGLEGGLETLGDQPLIKTFTNLGKGQSLSKSIVNAGKGVPASFTPTMFKQINQVTDNSLRDPYDPNPAKYGLNLALNKTPFARTLPKRVNQFGEDIESFQNGTNSIMNVMFNPAFVARYKPTPETKAVLDLYRNTSDTRILPIIVGNKLDYKGISLQLKAKDKNYVQKIVGMWAKNHLSQLSKNQDFIDMSDDEKVKQLSADIRDMSEYAKKISFYLVLSRMPQNKRRKYLEDYLKRTDITERRKEEFIEDVNEFPTFLNNISQPSNNSTGFDSLGASN